MAVPLQEPAQRADTGLELGSLASLEELFLYDNQLSGPIPAELGSLANLRWLELSGNQLTGPHTAWVANL